MRAAFSLIELLVVIGIIVVLSGLLLATIPLVLDLARSTACRAHLRQLALAHAGYLADWNGVLPAHVIFDRRAGAIPQTFWFEALLPYADIDETSGDGRNYKVLAGRRTVFRGCPLWKDTTNGGLIGYGRNYQLLRLDNNQSDSVNIAADGTVTRAITYVDARLDRRSNRILFGDSANRNLRVSDNPPYVLTEGAPRRHRKSANYAMVDGRVMALTPVDAAGMLANPATAQ